MAVEEKSIYPQWWNFDEDGDGARIEGTFVRAGRGFTQQGEKTFVVLLVGDVERTVWLHHDVLANAFARELHRRPDKRFNVGEQIVIAQLGMRDSKAGGKMYMNYQVEFPDGPEVSQVDVFGPPPDQRQQQQDGPAESTSGGNGFDDDIPFEPR
jgi:hypothetical protein